MQRGVYPVRTAIKLIHYFVLINHSIAEIADSA